MAHARRGRHEEARAPSIWTRAARPGGLSHMDADHELLAHLHRHVPGLEALRGEVHDPLTDEEGMYRFDVQSWEGDELQGLTREIARRLSSCWRRRWHRSTPTSGPTGTSRPGWTRPTPAPARALGERPERGWSRSWRAPRVADGQERSTLLALIAHAAGDLEDDDLAFQAARGLGKGHVKRLDARAFHLALIAGCLARQG